MERTGERNTGCAMPASRTARGLRAGLLLLVGALAAGGCYVVPAQTAYVAPGPAYVAPAPVYVAPAPVYVRPAPVYRWWGWRGHGWHGHGWHGHGHGHGHHWR
jgi:hypothetical protein